MDGTLVEWELKLELSVVHGTQLSSEWDLSLGAGEEPWVQAHNTLGASDKFKFFRTPECEGGYIQL